MLKGTDLWTGIIISGFVVLIFIGVFTVMINQAQIIASLEEGFVKFKAFDDIHIIENCLFDSSDAIDSDKIEQLTEKCGLGRKYGIILKDLSAGDSWSYNYNNEEKPYHEIYTNIRKGDEVHVGKIQIQV